MLGHDVLVVGLGPVGSTAANIAGELGLDCVGVDASEDVFDLPRAIHFDAEVMRVFQSIGIAAEVEALCRVTRGSVHLGADGEPIRDFRVVPARGQLGWFPHYLFYQPQLDQLLRDRASERPGVEILLGWRCEGVRQDADSVTATLRHPSGREREVSARHLIACDGAGSSIRKHLGIDLFDHGFEEPWLVVDVTVPDADMGPDYMVTHCDPSRPVVYIPGPGRHRRWEFMLLPDETAAEISTPERAMELVGTASPWLPNGGAELIRSAVYVFHGLVGKTWAESRITLAGDAIHQTPPFYGQGMCHGVRDVHNLLWKLALAGRDETTSPALLDSYELERKPHVGAIIEAAVENGRYICVLDPEDARRRDARYRAMASNGTDVRSWRGVIPSLEAGLLDEPIRSVAVGALIPQPRVRAGGGDWQLLDELLGPNFAIVGVADPLDSLLDDWFERRLGGQIVTVAPPGGATVDGELVEEEPALLARWFADHECRWALVRPDRYVFGVADEAAVLRDLVDRLRAMLAGEKALV